LYLKATGNIPNKVDQRKEHLVYETLFSNLYIFFKRKIQNAHEIKGKLKKNIVKPCMAAIKMARGNDLAASSRVMKERLLIENARVAALWWLVRQKWAKNMLIYTSHCHRWVDGFCPHQ